MLSCDHHMSGMIDAAFCDCERFRSFVSKTKAKTTTKTV